MSRIATATGTSAGGVELATPRTASGGWAEHLVCTLLRVPDRPRPVTERSTHRIFSISLAFSGLRCALSYLVLPIVVPAVGAAASIGAVIGIPVSIVALTFDVWGMRRFWVARHPWRWAMTAIYLAVMAMVTGLLVADLVHVAR